MINLDTKPLKQKNTMMKYLLSIWKKSLKTGGKLKITGIIPSAARDCSTNQFRRATLSELEFQQ
jgi:hypothetical protein